MVSRATIVTNTPVQPQYGDPADAGAGNADPKT